MLLPPQFSWLQALREPARALDWSLADWDRIVRLARRLRLLSRLAESLAEANLLDQVPAPARRHLIGEQRLSRWRIQALVWALNRIEAVLSNAPYPRVLLKGAAYIGQGLPIAAGRLPSDLDILVPQAHLADAVAQLERAGWSAGAINEHDRRYYDEWSHEVPPMVHPLHRVELDLHHNILPPVARTHVDAGLLLQRLKPSRWTAWQVLDPPDQVLHSAAHLFLDSDIRDRVRDLVDLDGLCAPLWRHGGLLGQPCPQGADARAERGVVTGQPLLCRVAWHASARAPWHGRSPQSGHRHGAALALAVTVWAAILTAQPNRTTRRRGFRAWRPPCCSPATTSTACHCACWYRIIWYKWRARTSASKTAPAEPALSQTASTLSPPPAWPESQTPATSCLPALPGRPHPRWRCSPRPSRCRTWQSPPACRRRRQC
jgi:hypothetical protein